MLLTGAAEAVHGVLEGRVARIRVTSPPGSPVERGAAQGEMVEGDVEEVYAGVASTHLSVCAARSETACSVAR